MWKRSRLAEKERGALVLALRRTTNARRARAAPLQLLAARANPALRTRSGEVALYFAALGGHAAAARVLLDATADDDINPLMWPSADRTAGARAARARALGALSCV